MTTSFFRVFCGTISNFFFEFKYKLHVVYLYTWINHIKSYLIYFLRYKSMLLQVLSVLLTGSFDRSGDCVQNVEVTVNSLFNRQYTEWNLKCLVIKIKIIGIGLTIPQTIRLQASLCLCPNYYIYVSTTRRVQFYQKKINSKLYSMHKN